MVVEYIRLKTKKSFKEVMVFYKTKHKMYMWGFFKTKTCYIPKDDIFISLDKAMSLGFVEIKNITHQ